MPWTRRLARHDARPSVLLKANKCHASRVSQHPRVRAPLRIEDLVISSDDRGRSWTLHCPGRGVVADVPPRVEDSITVQVRLLVMSYFNCGLGFVLRTQDAAVGPLTVSSVRLICLTDEAPRSRGSSQVTMNSDLQSTRAVQDTTTAMIAVGRNGQLPIPLPPTAQT